MNIALLHLLPLLLYFILFFPFITKLFENKVDGAEASRVRDASYSEVTKRSPPSPPTSSVEAIRQLSVSNEALLLVRQASSTNPSDFQTLADELRSVFSNLARLFERSTCKILSKIASTTHNFSKQSSEETV